MAGGSVIGSVGVALCSVAVLLAHTWMVMGSLAIIGWATGLFIGTNATVLLQRAQGSALGVVNATRLMLQNTGNVLSLAVSLTLLATVLPSSLGQGVLAGHVPASGIDRVTHAFVIVCCFLLVLGLFGSWFSFPRAGREAASENDSDEVDEPVRACRVDHGEAVGLASDSVSRPRPQAQDTGLDHASRAAARGASRSAE